MRRQYAELAKWAGCFALSGSIFWILLAAFTPIDQAFIEAFYRHQTYFFCFMGIGLISLWLAKRARN